jgi:hypothetical protein
MNIGVYKYMKIHVSLMSIYQNSDMCINTKKFIPHKINPFNYEDLNIFLQYYFIQLYCLIFCNFSIYIIVHYNISIYFSFFSMPKKIICTSHTLTHLHTQFTDHHSHTCTI